MLGFPKTAKTGIGQALDRQAQTAKDARSSSLHPLVLPRVYTTEYVLLYVLLYVLCLSIGPGAETIGRFIAFFHGPRIRQEQKLNSRTRQWVPHELFRARVSFFRDPRSGQVFPTVIISPIPKSICSLFSRLFARVYVLATSPDFSFSSSSLFSFSPFFGRLPNFFFSFSFLTPSRALFVSYSSSSVSQLSSRSLSLFLSLSLPQ